MADGIMRKRFLMWLMAALSCCVSTTAKKSVDTFPDGTPISEWFSDTTRVDVARLGKQYVITDYGIKNDSTVVQTDEIQKVIDRCASEGGGVVVIPRGTFLSGSLFFKKGTHLHLREGAVLKGIDDIRYYKIAKVHIEGQMLDYFAALVNAYDCDGFTISGSGTINGNGQRFWEEFWLRRKVNPKCTNLEALRPRLVYIANSNDVTVSGVRLINSGFWTNHLYRCNRVKYLGCYVFAPTKGKGPVKAPSSDGLDLDACSDVLVNGCYMNVNDDGVCLKGGKGTFVDKDSTSGPCCNIIVQNCDFGDANGGITFGSESWDDRNVIIRNCTFNDTWHVLFFKMRPDTPQKYEYVLAENCTGNVRKMIEISPWRQFYNKLDRPDMPRSRVAHVLMRNINLECTVKAYDIKKTDDFDIEDVKYENINVKETGK